MSGTTQVSRYQKGKTNLDFTEARDDEWQWHQLGHMQICTSLQTITMPAPHHSVFYRPDALPAAQPTVSKHWSPFPDTVHQNHNCGHLPAVPTLCPRGLFSGEGAGVWGKCPIRGCLDMCVNGCKIRYCHMIDSLLAATPRLWYCMYAMCWAGAPSLTREWVSEWVDLYSA